MSMTAQTSVTSQVMWELVSMGEAPTEPTCGFATSCWGVSYGTAPAATKTNHTAEVVFLLPLDLRQFGGWRRQVKHLHVNDKRAEIESKYLQNSKRQVQLL